MQNWEVQTQKGKQSPARLMCWNHWVLPVWGTAGRKAALFMGWGQPPQPWATVPYEPASGLQPKDEMTDRDTASKCSQAKEPVWRGSPRKKWTIWALKGMTATVKHWIKIVNPQWQRETERERGKGMFTSTGEDSSTKSLLWKVIKPKKCSNYPAFFFFRRNCSPSPTEVGKIYRSIPADKRERDDRNGGTLHFAN